MIWPDEHVPMPPVQPTWQMPMVAITQEQFNALLARITDLETALADHANRLDACEMQIEGLDNLSRRLEMEDGYGV